MNHEIIMYQILTKDGERIDVEGERLTRDIAMRGGPGHWSVDAIKSGKRLCLLRGRKRAMLVANNVAPFIDFENMTATQGAIKYLRAAEKASGPFSLKGLEYLLCGRQRGKRNV